MEDHEKKVETASNDNLWLTLMKLWDKLMLKLKGQEDVNNGDGQKDSIKIDRFSDQKLRLGGGWLIFFTVILLLGFGTMLYWYWQVNVPQDDRIATCIKNEVGSNVKQIHEEWGQCIILVLMGGLVGYALYLVKGVFDSEVYERKKNLEIDRKLYQEKIAHEMNREYFKYQQRKDEEERNFTKGKLCLEIIEDKKEFQKLKESFVEVCNIVKKDSELQTIRTKIQEIRSKICID